MTQTADKVVGDAILTKTHQADADITGNTFVKLVTPMPTGGPAHVVECGAGEAGVGVARDSQSNGRVVDVVFMGQMHVKASENIAAGAVVSSAANGQARNAVSTDHVLGRAISDANSGDYVRVQLWYGGIKA